MGYSGPPVVVCGRPLHVAADDLGLPALFFLSFRSILILLNALWLGLSFIDSDSSCSPLVNVQFYYALTLISTIVINAAYLRLYLQANKGDLFQHQLRTGVVSTIYILIALYLVETGINCFGAYVASLWTGDIDCGEVDAGVKLGLVIFWVVWIALDIGWFIGFAVVLTSSPKKKKTLIHLEEFDRLQYQWEKRCRSWCCWSKCLTCGLLGTMDGEYSDQVYGKVAEVFGAWFYGHDMSIIEFVTAFFLLRVEQRRRNEEKLAQMWDGDNFKVDVDIDEASAVSNEIQHFLWGDFEEQTAAMSGEIPKARKKRNLVEPKFQTKPSAKAVDARSGSEDRKQVQFVTDYLPYMLAIYGWKLLVYMDTIEFKPLRSISKLIKAPTRFGRHGFVSESDNLCHCAGSALMHQGGIKQDDIIYASFSVVEAISVPHAVMVDHDKLSIVVTCRGTLSLTDLLTDAMIEPTSLAQAGRRWGFEGEGKYAHQGMMLIAENIRIQLQKNQVLHRLLGVSPKNKVPTDLSPQEKSVKVDKRIGEKLSNLPDCTGYDIIILGHSLGGGVAAILAYLLKPEFPKLRCIAYSAPGCVFDAETCEQVRDWMITPFAGYDAVTHLSWHSLKKLRGQFLDVLRRSKVNKNVIFRKATLTRKSGVKLADRLLYREHDAPADDNREHLLDLIKELAKPNPESKLDAIRMGTPGKLLHFPKTTSVTTGCCKKDRTYGATWVTNEDMDKIELSSRMLLDHFPNFGAHVIYNANKLLVSEGAMEFHPSNNNLNEEEETKSPPPTSRLDV